MIKGYKPSLDVRETETAIYDFKAFFQDELAKSLNLRRVTAPLFVKAGSGINDDLNGVEKPVSFEIKDMDHTKVEIVQSLAKWKRLQLAELKIPVGTGIYADMNAIRPDEVLDCLHSVYVDQWDWEINIAKENRTIDFLKSTVIKIYGSLKKAERFIYESYPQIKPILPNEITFITTQELEDRFPDLTPQEREYRICEEKGVVFLIGIGSPLKSGKAHDLRAPDYDDWALNGDILVWHPLLKQAVELSSMGIRVDRAALEKQLEKTNAEERKKLFFHKKLLAGEWPYSIGGGIGQSRLCFYFFRKVHIGEVQVSIWPEEMKAACRENSIFLL